MIRRLAPLDGDEKVQLLDFLSASFASFRQVNETYARQHAGFMTRLEAVVGQIGAELERFEWLRRWTSG